MDIWYALMEFDLNNINHEWLFIAIMCFVFTIIFAIAWVSKYKECEEHKDEIEKLENTITELNSIIDDKTKRETEILENFGRKIDILAKENDKYKDADEYSKIFVDKVVVPIKVSETVDLTEGAYAYFVDESKKREFALQSTKREVIKGIVDILINKDYVWWENIYDERDLRHTVTGKLMVLADKEKERD